MTEITEILYQRNQGKSQRSIAKTLGISRNTVRNLLEKAQLLGFFIGVTEEVLLQISANLTKTPYKKPEKKLKVEDKLKPHHQQIAAWLDMPFMTKRQIKRLLYEAPYHLEVSESGLHRYLQKHFPAQKSVTMVLPTIPGEQAQVDYGYMGMMFDPCTKKLRKTQAFIMTLSHSRLRFVCFVFRQDTQTWIDCHKKAFEFFGGVPNTVLLDNLKAGVIKPHIYDPVLNPAYAECARHYGFIADPAKVRTPEHKGKVERSVTIVKQQVVAGREFDSIHEANSYALKWAKANAHQICRTVGETPWERFTRDEQDKLNSLPEQPFECPIHQEAKVQRDQHIVFQGAFYSVPEAFIGEKVSLRVTSRMVRIYHQYKVVKSHVRAHKKGQWVTDVNDLGKATQAFLDNTPEKCLQDAQEVGEAVLQVIGSVLARRSTTALRKARAILRLAQTYGNSRLNAACTRAQAFDNTTYEAIARILSLGLEKETVSPKKASGSSQGAFLRQPTEFTSVH